jgi:[ribosomal protein S5]-alanine N-acetyltransferase
MDSIAFRPELETTMQPVSRAEVSADVRETLPVLEGRHVTLRELRPSDASSLHALLTMPEVARFIAPPPATVDAFERFIFRTNRQRIAGRHVCFAVTLKGDDRAIGLFQIHETEAGFRTAEWGFALGSPFWGTGIFEEGANLILEFAFNTLGVHRLEARAAVNNGRGGRALQKLGAVQEGVLRKAFFRNGQYLDQVLYGIVQDDWRTSRGAFGLAGQTLVLH